MLIDSDTIIKLGEDNIVKAYLGESVVYENTSPTPTPYTELEYLESTGTQYIDSLFTPTLETSIEIDFQYTENTITGKTRVFGCRSTWNDGFYLGTSSNGASSTSKFWYLFNNSYSFSGVGTFTLDEHAAILNKSSFALDNAVLATFTNASFTQYAPICLFGAYDENTTTPITGIYKLYYCKIWDDGVLVRDFIPVLDSNNVPCLYDKVSQNFFYNAGSGDFLYSV